MRYYFVMGQLSTGKFENFIGNKESLYNQYLLLLPNCFEKKTALLIRVIITVTELFGKRISLDQTLPCFLYVSYKILWYGARLFFSDLSRT